MNQSSALRILEQILAEAVKSGDRNQIGISILLQTMKLSGEPKNIMVFYEILNKAKEEAKSIRNKSNLDRYISAVDELHGVFATNHLASAKWSTFANLIEAKNILNTLDALSDFFHSQNPRMILEEYFLEKLNNEFTSLLNQILKSGLPRELQRFLSDRIENILNAIRKYHIDRTDGLEKAIKSLVSDLVMTESTLKHEDRMNPIFNKVRAWSIGLLIWITPTPYDIIGAVPDIDGFWIPKFEQLHERVDAVNQKMSIATNAISIQEVSSAFSEELQKTICGGEDQKLLSPSAKDLDP